MNPFTYDQIKPLASTVGISITKITSLSSPDQNPYYEVFLPSGQITYTFQNKEEVIAFVMGYTILLANQLRDLHSL